MNNRFPSRFVALFLMVAAAPDQSRAEVSIETWPIASFYFDFARLGENEARQIEALQQLGYTGMAYNLVNNAQLLNFDKYAEVARERSFAIHAAYVPVTLRKDNTKNYAHLEKVIERLAKANASLWVITQKTDQDRTTVLLALNHIADMAKAAGVEFVLYPHFNTTMESAEEALEYINELGRDDVYVSLHLCHEIRAGNGDRLNEVAENIKPWLRLPSISGTDAAYDATSKGEWSQNIKPLGDGDYDASKLLVALESVDYEGPILLHTFGLQKARKSHHADSIKVYHEMLNDLNE